MISYFSRKWICVGLLFFLFHSGSARAQPEAPSSGFPSLSEAIQIALSHHPLIEEAQAQADISNERIAQARSGFMPRIDASDAYNRTTNPARAFATKLNQAMITLEDFNADRLNNPDAIDNYAGKLTAVWPLYDSGQTWYGVRGFYLSVPLALWLFGPVWMLAGSLILITVLYRLDREAQTYLNMGSCGFHFRFYLASKDWI